MTVNKEYEEIFKQDQTDDDVSDLLADIITGKIEEESEKAHNLKDTYTDDPNEPRVITNLSVLPFGSQSNMTLAKYHTLTKNETQTLIDVLKPGGTITHNYITKTREEIIDIYKTMQNNSILLLEDFSLA